MDVILWKTIIWNVSKLQAAYTAAGQILRFILIHGGELMEGFQQAYVQTLGFIQTHDGDANYDTITSLLKEVYRYMYNVMNDCYKI